MKTVRIGNGQGFWGDSVDAPVELLRGGPIDYIGMDYLAEVTMSIMMRQKLANPERGYAHDFVGFVRRTLVELAERNVKVVASAGGLNPRGCRAAILDVARELDVHGVRVPEQVVRLAERFLVRADQERTHVVGLAVQLVQLERRADVLQIDELVELAVGIAGEIAEGRLDRGLLVQADPTLLGVVMDNLLGNAWKFTSKRRGARIEVGARRDEDSVAYFVRDNGAGFDMNYAHKLFGVFQRLHQAADFEGTGIGLATVQRIVRRHGAGIGHQGAQAVEPHQRQGACQRRGLDAARLDARRVR